MNTNTITIGFDNSDIDSYTMQAANTLDKAFSVKKIICAHVEPKFDLWDALYHKDVSKLASEQDEVSTIKEQLEKTQQFCLDTKVKEHVEVVVKHGKVMKELINVLEENNSNLLVLGQQPTHTGHGTLLRNLIRRSSTNVLLVPRVSMRKLKTILVALDFSECSNKVVESISEIAKTMQDPLQVKFVHVNALPFDKEKKSREKFKEYRRGFANALNRAFKNLTEKFEFPERCQMDFLELTANSSNFHESIINAALEENADMIIVGNLGHSPYKQYYLGSVAEKLTLSDLPCATLFVKCNQ